MSTQNQRDHARGRTHLPSSLKEVERCFCVSIPEFWSPCALASTEPRVNWNPRLGPCKVRWTGSGGLPAGIFVGFHTL